MNVRDCLMHTTGLGWGIDGPLTMDKFLPAMMAIRGGRDGTLADMCTNLAEHPLEFSPGTQWLYGLSTDICGRLVELMSGQPLDDYLDEHLFDPLGMVDTGFSVKASEAHRLAANYIRDAEEGTAPARRPDEEHLPRAPEVPLRRRRSRRHVGGLPALRADARERRRTRRRPRARPQDGRADGDEPPARWRRAAQRSRCRAATARSASTAWASA